MIKKIPENSEVRQDTNQDYLVDPNPAPLETEPMKEPPVEKSHSNETFENASEKADFSKVTSNPKKVLSH